MPRIGSNPSHLVRSTASQPGLPLPPPHSLSPPAHSTPSPTVAYTRHMPSSRMPESLSPQYAPPGHSGYYYRPHPYAPSLTPAPGFPGHSPGYEEHLAHPPLSAGPYPGSAALAGQTHYHRPAMSSAEEREHKRRISHSAMERRRRERTNDIINELKDLIPWLRNEAKLQKLEVLEQCANYIKELQQQTKGRQSLSEGQQSSYERQQSPSEVQQSSYERQQSPSEGQQTAARKRQREASQYGGSSAGDDSPLLDDDEGDVLPSARTQRPPHRKSRLAEAGIGSAVPADKPRGNDAQPGLNDVAEIDAGSEESFKTSSSTLTITQFCTKGTKPGSPTKSSIGFLTS